MKVLSIFLLLFSYYSYGNQSCERFTREVERYSSIISEHQSSLARHTTILNKSENDFNQVKIKEKQAKAIAIKSSEHKYRQIRLSEWIRDKRNLAEAHCKLIKAQAEVETLSEHIKGL